MPQVTPVDRRSDLARQGSTPANRTWPAPTSRLLKLAFLATLWMQSALATAAGVLEVTGTQASWSATVYANLGPLGVLEDTASTGTVEMQSGVAIADTLLMDWEIEADQGGGGWRSMGALQAEHSLVYTLQPTGPTGVSLRTTGQVASTGEWMLQDSSGAFFTNNIASILPAGYELLTIRLNEAADLRLSGHLWETSGRGSVSGYLSFAPDVGPLAYLAQFSTPEDTQGIEFQWRMPSSGTLTLYAGLSQSNRPPCCNIAYGADAGWDLTLEASALAPVPEPASAALLLGGLAALHWRRRAHRCAASAPEQQP
jgi:PEP-CTERM motif